MKSILIFIFFIFLSSQLFTQVNLDWVSTYHGPANGGNFLVARTDANNNIYVMGEDFHTGGQYYDFVLIKYNTNGDSLWVRRFSDPTSTANYPSDMILDNNGNIYVTGYMNASSGGTNWITLKYNSSGNLLWAKQLDKTSDDRAVGLGVDSAGYLYVGGECDNNGDWSILAAKYNPVTGDTLWTAKYDQTSNSTEVSYAVTVDKNGNCFVTGYSMANSVWQSLLVKFTPAGSVAWAGLYHINGISGEAEGYAVKTDKTGNVFVAGAIYAGQTTFVDFLVMKYYPNGDTAWVRRYSHSNAIDAASSLAVDDSGYIYVTGKSYTGGGGSNNYDYLTVKYSPDGNLLWNTLYDGPAGHTEDEASSIVVDAQGNCYVTGASSSSNLYNSPQFATVKYDRNGNQLWVERNSSQDYGGMSVCLDSALNVYVCGSIVASSALIKYSQLTAIRQVGTVIPKSFFLSQNYPNPFNPTTKISYDLPKGSFVKLVVYDALGKNIKTLVNEKQNAGSYNVEFDGSNLPSGVYFYKLVSQNFTGSKKMILVK